MGEEGNVNKTKMIYTIRNENVFFICFRDNIFMGHHPFFPNSTPIPLVLWDMAVILQHKLSPTLNHQFKGL